MRKEEDRLASTSAAVARDEVAVPIGTGQDLDVARRESGSPQTASHPLGGDGGAAARVRRVGLDQFFQNVAPQMVVIGRRPLREKRSAKYQHHRQHGRTGRNIGYALRGSQKTVHHCTSSNNTIR